MKRYLILMLFPFAGCATAVDLTQTELAVATHSDLLAAASYAETNGYAARAAVWRALDAQLTACEKAITAAIPARPALPDGAGPIAMLEVAAEAAGNVSGVPASVKIACEPLPIIRFPVLVK